MRIALVESYQRIGKVVQAGLRFSGHGVVWYLHAQECLDALLQDTWKNLSL